MLASLSDWRAVAAVYTPSDATPVRPDFGLRYPWSVVAAHAGSSTLRRRVDAALLVLDAAAQRPAIWRLALSGGKDSLAVALLLLRARWRVEAVIGSDDAAMPGEEEHTDAFCALHGIVAERVRSPVSVLGMLRDGRIALTGDVSSRQAEVARLAFYEPMDAYRERTGCSWIWGCRAAESRGRRLNRASRGLLYSTATEGQRCQPIADWTGLDVHAWLALHDVPLPLPYLCIDQGQDPLSIRTDWWFAGGDHAALRDHYGWLRRWWPALWACAAQADPAVSAIS